MKSGFWLVLSAVLAVSASAQTVIPTDKEALLNGTLPDQEAVALLHGYPGPKQTLAMKDELGLSRDQQKKIEDLANGLEVSAKIRGEDIVAAEADLARLFEAGTATEKAIRTKVLEIARMRGELRYLYLQTNLKVKQILSANQIARFKELQPNEAK